MKKITIATAAAGALAAAAVGLAATASAGTLEGTSAADAVSSLQSRGFKVQLNGTDNVPLNRCTVTGVHGLSGAESASAQADPSRLNTVFLDIDCLH